MDNGNIIGQYEIREELSHGSITSVYRAYQPNLKRDVLIKKLHKKLIAEADIRDRFYREAQVCAKISHENIVSVYDFHSSEESTYLVLEFITGNSLGDILTGKPFPVEVAISIIIELLKGLKFAHDHAIIHRDIKPDNILISDDGHVKLSDFGLAVFEGAPTLTRQGMVVGTPAYMSPEQASGKKLTKNSDIFSLGIVFFEMLTGMNPFKGESLSTCIKKIISEPSPKLADYRDELPMQLEKILSKMLEKNNSKRYTECGEIIADINQIEFGDKLPSPKEVVRAFYKDGEAYETSRVNVTTTIASGQSLYRKRWSIYVSALAVIVISLYLIFGLAKEDNSISQTLKSVDSSHAAIINSAAENNEIDHSAMIDTLSSKLEESETSPDGESDDRIAVTPEIKPGDSKNPALADQKIVDIPAPSDEPAKEPETIIDGNSEKIEHEAENLVRQNGELIITCYPWADVYLNGKLLGQPPFARPFSLESGIYQILFIRPEYPVVRKDVQIIPGEKVSIDIKLWEHLGLLKVQTTNTWAEIWVDGEMLDRTPRADPLILPLGRHTIELKNPDYQPYSTELSFEEGTAEPLSIVVALEPIDK